MKIVRITFSFGSVNKEYFLDRAYDETKDDQTNCDFIIGYLVKVVEEGKALAVMTEVRKNVQPVIVNLKNVLEINILNVAVYETKPQEEPLQ
jgi:hypothetical protein